MPPHTVVAVADLMEPTMTALVPSPPAASAPIRVVAGANSWLEEALSADPGSAAELADLAEATADSHKARHAEKTQQAYDYWWGRLERWCELPATRYRLRGAPPLLVASLLPFDEAAERIVSLFLHDLFLGPKDPDVAEEWTGPPAPNTVASIVAALKARSGDACGTRWSPSTSMSNVLKGLRNKCRRAYGADRQATPLLSAHVAVLARHLWVPEPPEAVRDRLILELTAAGLTPGDIARLASDALLVPAGDLAALTENANSRLFHMTGEVAAESLLVPGRRRRSGHSDPHKLLQLDHHPALAASVHAWLDARPAGDGPLIDLAPSYRSGHVTKILLRLAELAQVAWRPSRERPVPPPDDVERMRSVLDAGVDWPGQVRRRRDLVMLLVGYLCALRRSELCALTVGDVQPLLKAPGLAITIERSKTSSVPARLPLHRATTAVPPYLDAVTLLASWVRFVWTLPGASPSTPLFPALDRWGHVLERRNRCDQLTRYEALDPQSWSNRLRELARETSVFGDALDEVYDSVSGHSLRRGYVTSALLAGIDTAVVAKQTRHKDLSMIQRYADELALLEGTNLVELVMVGAQAPAGATADAGWVDQAVRTQLNTAA